MTRLTKAQTAERDEARADLAALLVPGETVYTILRNVSRSGMTRHLDVYVMRDNAPRRITWAVGKACGYAYSDRWDALTVGGCGMDMGFHVVYGLSRTIYPDGHDCLGEQCPSNDHSNGDRDRTPRPMAHRDGGYCLNHRWLG